jgi:transposase
MTVFGVGPITAVAFEAAVEDPKRFKNAHKAEAYLGLVPGENSSGDGKNRTAITKTGSRLVRWLLVQAALTIMRTGKHRAPGLHAWAHGVAQRRGSKIARVALARRLAGILFAMLRDGKSFEPGRHAPATPTPTATTVSSS